MKNKILLLVCLLGMNVPMIGQTIKSSVHPIQYQFLPYHIACIE